MRKSSYISDKFRDELRKYGYYHGLNSYPQYFQKNVNTNENIRNIKMKLINNDGLNENSFMDYENTGNIIISRYAHYGIGDAINEILKDKTDDNTKIIGPTYCKHKEDNPADTQICITGKGNIGETPEESIIREINEELGIVISIKELKKVYDCNHDNKHYVTYIVNIDNCELPILKAPELKLDNKAKIGILGTGINITRVQAVVYGDGEKIKKMINGAKVIDNLDKLFGCAIMSLNDVVKILK